MHKITQALLLAVVVSIAAAARLSILGWLGIIGLGTVGVLGITHFYIHFYAMNSLSRSSWENVFKIILSHFFFLLLFLFQFDADDSRSYLVLDHILGKEDSGLGDFSNLILVVSLIFYVWVAIRIVVKAKKEKIAGANHILLIPAIVIAVVFPFVLIRAAYANEERQYARKDEAEGEYTSLARALKNKENVKILRVNPFESSYSSFPKEILELKNLTELYLVEQKISSIPDDIGELKNLEVLEMTDNDIHAINPALCNCTKLRSIAIGGNMQTLPDCLTALNNLSNLTIQTDSANTLMDDLRKFRTLKTAHFYTKTVLFDREKWWKLSKELEIE